MRLHPPERVAEYETMGLWGVPLWTERLAQWCRSRGDALALIDPPNLRALMGLASARYTWSEVADRAGHLADVLARHGIGRDDVVGVQLPNCADLAVTYLALSSLGAIATPFPMQYREYELRQMCELAGASAFLGAADFLGASREAILRELKAAHGIREVFTLGGREVPGCRDLTTALRMPSGPDRAAPPVERRARGLASLDPNDAVTICWTSGTEATPKGVPRCPNDWEPMGLTSVDAMGLGEDDVILNPFPMVNMAGIGGMFVPWLLSGSTLVLHHPFDAAIFFGQIQGERVTYTVAPPAVLIAALDDPALTPEVVASLRIVGSGAAPLPPSMIRAYKDRFDIDVVNCFGSNEGVNLVGDPIGVPDPERRSRMFARPDTGGSAVTNRGARGYRLRLVDPDRGEVIEEAGVTGELEVRGPGVMSGYLAGTAVSDPFTDDGYLRSGDLFRYEADDDGVPRFLQYVDRAKDLIVRGGMNISPAELEALIVAHPNVAEVAVVGVPDARLGERTRAVIVPRAASRPPDLADIVEHLRRHRIASYKLPEDVRVVSALPRNPVGKVLKRRLREAGPDR